MFDMFWDWTNDIKFKSLYWEVACTKIVSCVWTGFENGVVLIHSNIILRMRWSESPRQYTVEFGWTTF